MLICVIYTCSNRMADKRGRAGLSGVSVSRNHDLMVIIGKIGDLRSQRTPYFGYVGYLNSPHMDLCDCGVM